MSAVFDYEVGCGVGTLDTLSEPVLRNIPRVAPVAVGTGVLGSRVHLIRLSLISPELKEQCGTLVSASDYLIDREFLEGRLPIGDIALTQIKSPVHPKKTVSELDIYLMERLLPPSPVQTYSLTEENLILRVFSREYESVLRDIVSGLR